MLCALESRFQLHCRFIIVRFIGNPDRRSLPIDLSVRSTRRRIRGHGYPESRTSVSGNQFQWVTGYGSIMKKAGSATSKLLDLLVRIIGTLSVVTVCHVMLSAVAFCVPDVGNGSFTEADSVRMPCIKSLHALERAILIIDGAENALLAADLEDKKRQSIYSRFDEAGRILAQSLEACKSLSWSPEKARIWNDFIRALERWNNDHERFVELAREHEEKRTAETYKRMSAQALEVNLLSLSGAVTLLDAIIEASFEPQGDRNDTNEVATSPYQGSFLPLPPLRVTTSGIFSRNRSASNSTWAVLSVSINAFLPLECALITSSVICQLRNSSVAIPA